jgi:hypothetical protein
MKASRCALGLVSLGLLVLTTATAEATTVTMTYSGTITANSFSGVSVGDPFTATIVYTIPPLFSRFKALDGTILSTSAGAVAAIYEFSQSGVGYTLTADALSASGFFTSPGNILILNDATFGTDPTQNVDLFSAIGCAGSSCGFEVLLDTETPKPGTSLAIQSVDLPTLPFDLTLFSERFFDFAGCVGSNCGDVQGTITSMTLVASASVPEPSPIVLLGLAGMLAVSWTVRRKVRR